MAGAGKGGQPAHNHTWYKYFIYPTTYDTINADSAIILCVFKVDLVQMFNNKMCIEFVWKEGLVGVHARPGLRELPPAFLFPEHDFLTNKCFQVCGAWLARYWSFVKFIAKVGTLDFRKHRWVP